jgi:hypothetical protein
MEVDELNTVKTTLKGTCIYTGNYKRLFIIVSIGI